MRAGNEAIGAHACATIAAAREDKAALLRANTNHQWALARRSAGARQP
jgi:hypothetical protein